MSGQTLLRLWTIQNETGWENLQRVGEIQGDGTDVDSYFFHAYQWMMHQMRKRLPTYGGGWPVWAWVRWSPDSPWPDLRASGHLERGTRGVRIELVVPADQVLVSDFEAWHFVLNNSYFAYTEEEWEDWCRREDAGLIAPGQLQGEKERSWERTFDLSCARRDPEWCGRVEDVMLQATAERFTIDQVVTVDHFHAR